MQYQIGVVELYTHNEVLIHYCDLLLPTEYSVFVFCREEIYKDIPSYLKESKINWILKKSDSPLSTFFSKNEKLVKECNLLLITTIFSHFKVFTKLANWAPTVVTLHSAHTWLDSYKYISFRKESIVMDVLRLGKFILERQAKDRTKLLKTVKFIALPNDSILEYVNSNFLIASELRFVSLPFGAYLGKPVCSKNSLLTFTITGSISDEVRDYDLVLSAFKRLLPKLNKKIRLVLLGKPRDSRGKKLKNAFDQIKHPCLEIVSFSGYITQATYDQYLLDTHYLILPLKKYTQFGIFQELTCLSKLSGSVNDMIKYGIQGIASRFCTIDKDIDRSLLYFNNARHLSQILNQLIDKPLIDKSAKEKEKIFNNFSKDKLRESIEMLINKL